MNPENPEIGDKYLQKEKGSKIDKESTQNYEWLKYFDYIEGLEPYEIKSKYFLPEEVLSAIKKIFPDKKFPTEIKKDEVFKHYRLDISESDDLEYRSSGREWYGCTKLNPKKYLSSELPTLSDVINFVRNPKKTIEDLNRREKEQWFRFELIEGSIKLMECEGRIQTGCYELTDENSAACPRTLGMIFAYGPDKNMFERVHKILLEKKGSELSTEIRKCQPLKGISILDIGCGKYGGFVKFLRELGADAVGIDIQESKDKEGAVLRGNISKYESLPEEIKNRKFDLVISTMTFVSEIEGIGSGFNALRFVKDGGYCIFSPKNHEFERMEEEVLESYGFIDLDKQHPFDRPSSLIEGPTVINKILSSRKNFDRGKPR